MSYNHFNQLVKKISEKSWNEAEKYTETKNPEIPFHVFVSYAVSAWCEEIDFLDSGMSEFIKTEPLKEIEKFIKDIEPLWKQQKKEASDNLNKDYLQKIKEIIIKNSFFKTINKGIKEEEGTTFLILIAFAIVAVGYVLYLLQSNSDIQPQSTDKQSSPPAVQQIKEDNHSILLLVINASKKNLIETLKLNHQITSDVSNDIYPSIQALWIGNKAEFSHFKTWFSKEQEVQENEYSEYDVYLVKIELKQSDNGFIRNANQLDRFDAFRRLPDNTLKVYISPRLPSKAYANKDFYSR